MEICYFKQLKDSNKQSDDAKKMEIDVQNSSDWAVRIEKVSRLFISDEKKPIGFNFWNSWSKWSRKNNADSNDHRNSSTFFRNDRNISN